MAATSRDDIKTQRMAWDFGQPIVGFVQTLSGQLASRHTVRRLEIRQAGSRQPYTQPAGQACELTRPAVGHDVDRNA